MGRASTGPFRRKGRGWFYTVAGMEYRLPGVDKDASRKAATTAWAALRHDEAPQGDLTLKEALQAFLAARRGSSSYAKYGQLVGNFARFRGWETPVSEIIPNDVTRWWAERTTWGETMRGSALRHLKACLNWCVSEGLLEENPVAAKKAPRPAAREFVFTAEAFAAALAHCGPEIAALASACWHTGARPSELARALREYVAPNGSAIALPTGKQGSRRITFPRSEWEGLAKRREETRIGRAVFPDHLGGTWTRHTWARAWVPARDAAGLPREANIYQLRHSWISRNVAAGVPLAVVAKQVGTSIAMISQVYAHLQPGDVDGWRERMV